MRKRRLKNYSILLYIIFILMLGVCVFLSADGDQEVSNIAVNASLFVVVGLIFLYARSWLDAVFSIASELRKAGMELKKEFKEEGIFQSSILKERYEEYKKALGKDQFSCDIEDFINKDLIDTVARKNLLNLVPGTMTGLGILGTFIGLSFGLQSFNTGSAAEISASIAPLMDGIKVAFHTSIYGMVFSLIFNFVYKNILEEAYDALDDFIDSYHLHVKNDMSKLLAELPERIGNVIADRMMEVMEKYHEKR